MFVYRDFGVLFVEGNDQVFQYVGGSCVGEDLERDEKKCEDIGDRSLNGYKARNVSREKGMMYEVQVIEGASGGNEGINFGVPKFKLKAGELEAERSLFGSKKVGQEIGEEAH